MGISPGLAILFVLLLIVWIVVLVWVGQRMLAFIQRRTGWHPRDWRNWASCTVALVLMIHLANWLIDLLGALADGRGLATGPGFPPWYLIAAVAIAVPLAALRMRGD